MSMMKVAELVEQLEACKSEVEHSALLVEQVEKEVGHLGGLWAESVVQGLTAAEMVDIRSELLKLQSIANTAANRYKAAEKEVREAVDRLAEEDVLKSMPGVSEAAWLELSGLFDDHFGRATLRLEECSMAAALARTRADEFKMPNLMATW